MKINEIFTKKIITKSNLPDVEYVINPYIGCQHACIYCYADFMKRFTGHTNEKWGEFIDVKINSAETVMEGKSFNNTILLGSVTDCYQQTEKKYQITRQLLIKLLKIQPKMEILTKSGLITRDLDLLTKFTNLRVGISISSMDLKISKKLEPFASTPSARLRVLQSLKENGIDSYLFISPIFPYITDYKVIINKVKPFVTEVCFENLNIRPNNRSNILAFIKSNRPDLIDFYSTLPANKGFWLILKNEIIEYCMKNQINYKIYFNHSTDKIKRNDRRS